MINWNDIVTLMKLCAACDQRTVGEEDIQAWYLIATRAHWTKATAQRVIIEHYAEDANRPRITPAQITDGIRAARRQAAGTFEAPVIPDPPPANYPAWYREQLAQHIDRLLVDWADGKPIPIAKPTEELQALQARTPTQRAALESMHEFVEKTRIR